MLAVTPNIAQEFIPCDETRELIQSVWDNLRGPGIYGGSICLGSFWYIEGPIYINYLVEVGKKDTAVSLLKMLLDETLNCNDDLPYHAGQLMNKHRLGQQYRVTLEEIEKMLNEAGY